MSSVLPEAHSLLHSQGPPAQKAPPRGDSLSPQEIRSDWSNSTKWKDFPSSPLPEKTDSFSSFPYNAYKERNPFFFCPTSGLAAHFPPQDTHRASTATTCENITPNFGEESYRAKLSRRALGERQGAGEPTRRGDPRKAQPGPRAAWRSGQELGLEQGGLSLGFPPRPRPPSSPDRADYGSARQGAQSPEHPLRTPQRARRDLRPRSRPQNREVARSWREEGCLRPMQRRRSRNVPPLRAGKQVAAEPRSFPVAAPPRLDTRPSQEANPAPPVHSPPSRTPVADPEPSRQPG